MKIIDGQIHLWWKETAARPWSKRPAHFHGEKFDAEDALKVMDDAGVSGAILIPPSWNAFDNSYALDAAIRFPHRFGVFGLFDVLAPDAKRKFSEFIQPGMLGLRLTIVEGTESIVSATSDWLWNECSERSIPVMCAAPDQLRELGDVAKRFPGVQIIVDHAARKPRAAMDEAAWANLDILLDMAQYGNVSVKVSSLPCFTTQPFPFPVLHAPLKKIYERFGARRMIWGSDSTRLTCPYLENIHLFTRELPFLSQDDIAWVMGRSLAERCKWMPAP